MDSQGNKINALSVGSVSAMDKIDVSSILQPSDLFGKEILPECTFESEYGKLKFNAVFVPDFSNDKIELELLTRQFDDIKAFIKEEDLLKKSAIAKKISEKVYSHVSELINKGVIQYWCNEKCGFRNILHTNVSFRLFEEGKCLDYAICQEFRYSSPDEFNSGILSYNSRPVKHPLMYGAGVYIIAMKKALKPSNQCSKWIRKISEKILFAGLPKHNYLSWAFCNASFNNELLSFILEKIAPGWD